MSYQNKVMSLYLATALFVCGVIFGAIEYMNSDPISPRIGVVLDKSFSVGGVDTSIEITTDNPLVVKDTTTFSKWTLVIDYEGAGIDTLTVDREVYYQYEIGSRIEIPCYITKIMKHKFCGL